MQFSVAVLAHKDALLDFGANGFELAIRQRSHVQLEILFVCISVVKGQCR
jgi:hypothetical protein